MQYRMFFSNFRKATKLRNNLKTFDSPEISDEIADFQYNVKLANLLSSQQKTF